jgi:hypothetical protein
MHRGWLWLGLWIAIASVGVGQAVPRSVEAIPRSVERITLYWLPPRGETPSAYRVFLDEVQVAEVDGAAKSYDFTGLTAGREYRLAVQAVYPDGRVSERVERVDRTYRALPAQARYPILIVGGTASGVGAAITAARMGVKVALMEPTNRLGGMITNGVAVTDVRQRDRINGLYEEFRQRVEAYYKARGDDTSLYFYRNGLNFEPWVANMLIKQMVYAEPNIDLYFGVRPTRVFKKGNRITGVEFVTLDGARRGRFTADIVIDATAEGDIAAWAGAPYRIGREPRSPEEPHAGVLYYDRLNDRFLPGSTGEGDRRIPGYAILMIVQNYPTPQVGDPPPGYNRLNYVLSPPWERSWAYLYGRIPGNKFEVNQHPHGTTLQEVNYRYPTASWEERQRIYQVYKNHVLGYLHYIQTELGQPNLGLAEDEFRDSDNLPPILYVRKARRIEGEVFSSRWTSRWRGSASDATRLRLATTRWTRTPCAAWWSRRASLCPKSRTWARASSGFSNTPRGTKCPTAYGSQARRGLAGDHLRLGEPCGDWQPAHGACADEYGSGGGRRSSVEPTDGRPPAEDSSRRDTAHLAAPVQAVYLLLPRCHARHALFRGDSVSGGAGLLPQRAHGA